MEDQYYLVGVVTGNPSSCGGKTLPDVYNYVGNVEVVLQITIVKHWLIIISVFLDLELDFFK